MNGFSCMFARASMRGLSCRPKSESDGSLVLAVGLSRPGGVGRTNPSSYQAPPWCSMASKRPRPQTLRERAQLLELLTVIKIVPPPRRWMLLISALVERTCALAADFAWFSLTELCRLWGFTCFGVRARRAAGRSL